MTQNLFSGKPARDVGEQQVTYIAFPVVFSDTQLTSGNKQVGTIPAGAVLIGTDVAVQEVFNAVTTNVLTVGTNNPTTDNIVAAADVTEGSLGLAKDISPTGTALAPFTVDTPVYAKYTQTGTAATTGRAAVIIKYVASVS